MQHCNIIFVIYYFEKNLEYLQHGDLLTLVPSLMFVVEARDSNVEHHIVPH